MGQYWELRRIIDNLLVSNNEDRRIWKWEGSHRFSVKTYYQFLVDGGIGYAFHEVWKFPSPLKVKIIIWFVFRSCLNTKDRLIIKGVHVNPCCVLCDKTHETHEHLF